MKLELTQDEANSLIRILGNIFWQDEEVGKTARVLYERLHSQGARDDTTLRPFVKDNYVGFHR